MKEQELQAELFAEFPAVSKAEWLNQIRKDLKGKQLEDLQQLVATDLRVDPFAHADDFTAPPMPLSADSLTWQICEDVKITDPAAANHQIIQALEGGAEGICLQVAEAPGPTDLGLVLSDVYLDYIGLHFAGSGAAQNPGAVLAALSNLAKTRNLKTSALKGSLAYDPAAASELQDWRYAADLIEYASAHFPGFHIITLTSSKNDPVDMLSDLLEKGNLHFRKLTEKGLTPAVIAAPLQFSIPIGAHYFLEIATLRAFKLLWLNFLKGWNAPLQSPFLAVHFHPDAYTEALYTNMIRGTTMAMSAVLGGADRLTVRPYDDGREQLATYPPPFARRMARNVQHLLKMESFFAQATDPAAGSYYLEKLTAQLAEKAWAQFQDSNK